MTLSVYTEQNNSRNVTVESVSKIYTEISELEQALISTDRELDEAICSFNRLLGE